MGSAAAPGGSKRKGREVAMRFLWGTFKGSRNPGCSAFRARAAEPKTTYSIFSITYFIISEDEFAAQEMLISSATSPVTYPKRNKPMKNAELKSLEQRAPQMSLDELDKLARNYVRRLSPSAASNANAEVNAAQACSVRRTHLFVTRILGSDRHFSVGRFSNSSSREGALPLRPRPEAATVLQRVFLSCR